MVAIPFRVGWGFSQFIFFAKHLKEIVQSQSLSGWDGVFHRLGLFSLHTLGISRNPFQGGMGFFTC